MIVRFVGIQVLIFIAVRYAFSLLRALLNFPEAVSTPEITMDLWYLALIALQIVVTGFIVLKHPRKKVMIVLAALTLVLLHLVSKYFSLAPVLPY